MMKKSAKILSVILSLAMGVSAFSLAACNTEPEKKPDDPPAHTHTYAATWSTDETNHWHAATCEHKTEVKDKAAHTFTDNTCTVCGYKKTVTPPVEEHKHTFSATYVLSDTQHWKVATCEHKDEKSELANHDTNGTGGTCSVCGFKAHTHTYKYEYYSTKHYQYKTCQNCSNDNIDAPEMINLEDHVWDEDGTTCKICKFKHVYKYPAEVTGCITCEECGGCIRMQCPNAENEGHTFCSESHGENAKHYELEAEDAEVFRVGEDAPEIIDNSDGSRDCVHASYSNIRYTITVSKATTATLRIRCGMRAREEVTKWINVFVNGADEEFASKQYMCFPDTSDGKCSMDWLDLGCISLVDGENVIEVNQNAIHIDKIELITSSDVTITMEKIDNSKITNKLSDVFPTIDKYKKKAA